MFTKLSKARRLKQTTVSHYPENFLEDMSPISSALKAKQHITIRTSFQQLDMVEVCVVLVSKLEDVYN